MLLLCLVHGRPSTTYNYCVNLRLRDSIRSTGGRVCSGDDYITAPSLEDAMTLPRFPVWRACKVGAARGDIDLLRIGLERGWPFDGALVAAAKNNQIQALELLWPHRYPHLNCKEAKRILWGGPYCEHDDANKAALENGCWSALKCLKARMPNRCWTQGMFNCIAKYGKAVLLAQQDRYALADIGVASAPDRETVDFLRPHINWGEQGQLLAINAAKRGDLDLVLYVQELEEQMDLKDRHFSISDCVKAALNHDHWHIVEHFCNASPYQKTTGLHWLVEACTTAARLGDVPKLMFLLDQSRSLWESHSVYQWSVVYGGAKHSLKMLQYCFDLYGPFTDQELRKDSGPCLYRAAASRGCLATLSWLVSNSIPRRDPLAVVINKAIEQRHWHFMPHLIHTEWAYVGDVYLPTSKLGGEVAISHAQLTPRAWENWAIDAVVQHNLAALGLIEELGPSATFDSARLWSRVIDSADVELVQWLLARRKPNLEYISSTKLWASLPPGSPRNLIMTLLSAALTEQAL